MGETFGGGGANAPSVGSDEVVVVEAQAQELPSSANKPDSRVGDQRPSQLLSGGLTGSLSSGGELDQPLDGFFQNDQPQASPAGEATEPRVQHSAPVKPSRKHNDKLNGWLDQHHNKFVPRTQLGLSQSAGQLSNQLAANLNQLAPSFSANLNQVAPVRATPSVDSSHGELTIEPSPASASTGALEPYTSSFVGTNDSSAAVQWQTITKTYSTVMTTSKTRLVPLQVKSSTGIHTITENYVITKMMTAFQTLPVAGEFILPEPSASHAPFELFNEPSSQSAAESKRTTAEQPIQAPSGVNSAPAMAGQEEQPISLASDSPKSANNWLHDFSNPETGSAPDPQAQQQQDLAAALLEQQQQQHFPQLLSSEPLDQLASSLDPAQLLANGAINIPDLNNPLVLAAAIQNPQLAAVILAAQQLQLKQRQQAGLTNKQQLANQMAPQGMPSVSLSTSLSTTIRPSTYTVRDTMYTTRLVSFRDGRTTRTRTVSEPGSVIEQVLTTMATEVTPVTVSVAIRPTAALQLAGAQASAGLQQVSANQNTLNNALLASQLASLLARRQQQLQPSSSSPNLTQLAALQQLIGGRQTQQQQQRPLAPDPSARAFQPNLQQMLQSMEPRNQTPAPRQQVSAAAAAPAASTQQPTPELPVTTTLTSLQVRTYTVHNAFKTIFRTITSTQLVTSTLFPARALG